MKPLIINLALNLSLLAPASAQSPAIAKPQPLKGRVQQSAVQGAEIPQFDENEDWRKVLRNNGPSSYGPVLERQKPQVDPRDPCWRMYLDGQWDAAEDCYAQVLERDSKNADSWFVIGMIRERSLQIPAALVFYEQGARRINDPRFRKAVNHMKLRLVNNGQRLNFNFDGYRKKDCGNCHDSPDLRNESVFLMFRDMRRRGIDPKAFEAP